LEEEEELDLSQEMSDDEEDLESINTLNDKNLISQESLANHVPKIKPKQKKLDNKSFRTLQVRADVIIKTIFRNFRKFYLKDFYE